MLSVFDVKIPCGLNPNFVDENVTIRSKEELEFWGMFDEDGYISSHLAYVIDYDYEDKLVCFSTREEDGRYIEREADLKFFQKSLVDPGDWCKIHVGRKNGELVLILDLITYEKPPRVFY